MPKSGSLLYSEWLATSQNSKEVHRGNRLLFHQKSDQPRIRRVHPKTHEVGAVLEDDSGGGFGGRMDFVGHIARSNRINPLDHWHQLNAGVETNTDAYQTPDHQQQGAISQTQRLPLRLENLN